MLVSMHAHATRPPKAVPGRMPLTADRLLNRPWFIARDALRALVAQFQADVYAGDDDQERAYPMTEDGIACIPITGPLTRGAYWRTTAYSEIQGMCAQALADSNCQAILLCFDSSGGEASGLFDLADYLHASRGQKPVAAVSDDRCYSAAYCLASAADRIFVTRTGGTGSIGVWTAHVDMSKMLEQEGVAVTYIFAGTRKVDGNPYEPLSDAARETMQTEVDRLRALFVETVARNRGASADDLYKTEAAIFMADAGIPLLADEMGGINEALAYLRGRIAAPAADPAPVPDHPDNDNDGDNPQDDPDQDETSGRAAALASRLIAGFPCPEARVAALAGGALDITLGATAKEAHAPLVAIRRFGSAALAAAAGGRPARVWGLLAPYGSVSLNLGNFREIYQQGCFSEWLKSGEDACVCDSHNPEKVLGRLAAGTARFSEDTAGLHYEADLPDTQAGRDMQVSTARGDIRGASAAFYISKYRWENDAEGRVRVVEKARLLEGSPYAFPAYEHSTAAAAAPEASQPSADTGYEVELIRARLELLRIA